jgi:hypothetical protein
MNIRNLVALLAVVLAGAASAQPLAGTGTAEIDGDIGAAEWEDSATRLFTVNEPGAGVDLASISVMNDSTNLYFAFQIPYLGGGIDVTLYFDASGDGQTVTSGDDAIGFYTATGSVRDLFQLASTIDFDTQALGTNDVVAASSSNGVVREIELSHPLDSGDSQGKDISVGADDTLPFFAMIRLPGPLDTFYPGPVAGIEAEILIVPEPEAGAATAGVLAVLWLRARGRRAA